PFNPVTTIKYQIPLDVKRQMINLKLVVYDVLGREVATLVNRQQKPGYYEVEWNSKNNSSGTYFYRIVTPNFADTKKMILLK
ncbi:MAG: T9SS type A sorting domain-containing protein, partial [Melioribacteraceae bacterium]|nr:T9SS type A sorting domain-containing protein [Melioribacteraceae bacterium]